jgi:DNA-binding beta-propeller fold protein YncE
MMIAAVCVSTLALGVATANAVLVSLGTFGSQGSGAGQLQTPVGVAVAPTSGNVFIADSGNARVEVFGPKGNFIAAWGWGVTDGKAQSEVCTANCQAGIPGSGAGQFSNPTSIAAASNRVYVGDAGNNVVLVFHHDTASPTTSTAPPTTTTTMASPSGAVLQLSRESTRVRA